MVFGLGSKQKDNKAKSKASGKTKAKKSSSQSEEAAEILKKMEAKKDDGECAFC